MPDSDCFVEELPNKHLHCSGCSDLLRQLRSIGQRDSAAKDSVRHQLMLRKHEVETAKHCEVAAAESARQQHFRGRQKDRMREAEVIAMAVYELGLVKPGELM
jgi:hypothetical protein